MRPGIQVHPWWCHLVPDIILESNVVPLIPEPLACPLSSTSEYIDVLKLGLAAALHILKKLVVNIPKQILQANSTG